MLRAVQDSMLRALLVRLGTPSVEAPSTHTCENEPTFRASRRSETATSDSAHHTGRDIRWHILENLDEVDIEVFRDDNFSCPRNEFNAKTRIDFICIDSKDINWDR